jgi:hypothetical protein
VVTGQKLNEYLEQFGNIEVTFTRKVAEVLGLLPKYVYLKVQADILQCAIYSSSMREARVIANLRASTLASLGQAGNAVALRFCFQRPDRADSLSFYVSARITSLNAYSREAPEMHLLSLEYTNRPPDDLIEILGELLEANVNARRRKEVRIDVTLASMKALGLESREAVLVVQEAERHCLLKDVSFSGAKVLVYGQVKSLVEKSAVLYLRLAGEPKPVGLPGRILRYETAANREDIGALAILFEEQRVPMPYKIAINNFLRSHRDGRPPGQGPVKPSG